MKRLLRRDFLRLGSAAACPWFLPRAVYAQTDGTDPVRKPELITPATQKAIDAGLSYLAKRQIRSGPSTGALANNGYGGGVAVTGLTGLAFMVSGDPPGQGPYGQHVNRCVDFLIRNTQDTGYCTAADGNDRMYGHGFATLCMAQAYGMSNRKDLRSAVEKAVGLIVETQNEQGGWRYMPRKQDADLSITICQVMALRAAADAGLSVPKATRDRAIRYVKSSQRRDGAFMYSAPSGHVTLALTAAGLVALYSSGIHEGGEIDLGLKWMMQFVPGGQAAVSHNYFYMHYYAVQAAWHAGGDKWNRWYPAIRNELLRKQTATDGSWHDPSIGTEYGTAMACIILQMPNNAVPIFAE